MYFMVKNQNVAMLRSDIFKNRCLNWDSLIPKKVSKKYENAILEKVEKLEDVDPSNLDESAGSLDLDKKEENIDSDTGH